MNERGFDLHPLAADLEIHCGGKPAAAHRVSEDLLEAIRTLVPFPHQGHRRPDLTSRPLRFKRARDHFIAYAPDEKPLWVVAVMHARRSPRVMAAILRGRE